MTNFNFVCFYLSCISPAGTCPMSFPPTVWCVMAPVLSGVWWGPEAGVVGSGAAAATGVASWLGSGQLVLVVTLSILAALLLVSVLLLLCASCQGWAPSRTQTQTHVHEQYWPILLLLLFSETLTYVENVRKGWLVSPTVSYLLFMVNGCCAL